MKFYNFNSIKESCDCLEIARAVLGLPVSNDGRCAATWRGGDNQTTVSINDRGFYDHKIEQGGSVIDLVAKVKFNGSIPLAQEFLGDYLHLSPTTKTKPHVEPSARYEELIKKGYKEVKRYDYIDLDGNIKHQKARLEHADPNIKKEFMQCTPSGWGLRNTTPILYNLKAITESNWIVVVEGEKDADTLISLGVPATTSCGGSNKWRTEYNKVFQDKAVIILRDNDEAGMDHAKLVASNILGIATQIQIVCPSTEKKGDVTDFINSGGTWDQLAQIISTTPIVTEADIQEREYSKEDAKDANQTDIRNFIPTRVSVGNVVKIKKEPLQITQLTENIRRRFLGFPRKIMEQMFDHDQDSGDIEFIHNSAALFSWMAIKSKRKIEWSKGEEMVPRQDLYEGLVKTAKRYQSISYVPDWPPRQDVYYAHSKLPKPHPEHKYFNGLIDFFHPASDTYKTILKAFVISPIFYILGVPRPLWVIDSEDGAGTGKTTIVETVAMLYGNKMGKGGSPIRTSKQELKTDVKDLVKRIVSSEGRQSRVFLVDNVTGKFISSELADFITSWGISGKSPYGRGEETRPNNLTYCITANSATIDNDLAERTYVIKVRRPKYNATWKTEVIGYINAHRMEIFADIIDILENHEPLDAPPTTRCPEFEMMILQAVCADMEEYSNAVKAIINDTAESNIDDDVAKSIEDELRYNLRELNISPIINPDTDKVFIRTTVLQAWFENSDVVDKSGIVQVIRNLAKLGLIENVDKKVNRYPNNGPLRRRGILWNPPLSEGKPRIIGKINSKTIGEIA